MLLSKVPHSITSAYKFSVDGPLGAKPPTLAGLVARYVQYLEVFFKFLCFIRRFIAGYNTNYSKFTVICCCGAIPALKAE